MTEEAIEKLEYMRDKIYFKSTGDTYLEIVESLNLAIKSLEKQTPKKVTKTAEMPIQTATMICWECPSCTEPLVTLTPYCSQCGQALR